MQKNSHKFPLDRVIVSILPYLNARVYLDMWHPLNDWNVRPCRQLLTLSQEHSRIASQDCTICQDSPRTIITIFFPSCWEVPCHLLKTKQKQNRANTFLSKCRLLKVLLKHMGQGEVKIIRGAL